MSFLMVAAMLLLLLPTTFAEETIVEYAVEGGNIRFDLATGTIIGADKSVTVAHIPETIEGVNVTAIGRDAFAHYGGEARLLREIVLPDTVISVGDYAFYSCAELEEINLPDGIERIDTSTFHNCIKLKCVDFPANLKSIEPMAFDNCTALEKIELPEGLESIDSGAFDRCTSLAEINIPSTVKNCTSFIGTAFYNDEGNWSGNCLYLDNWLLAAKDQEKLIIPEGIIGIANNAVRDISILKTVLLPEGLRYIGSANFEYCSKIDEVIFPASLECLGNYAFYQCGAYLDAYFKGPAPEIGNKAFYWIDPFGYEIKETISDGLMFYFVEGQEGWSTPVYKEYPTTTWTPGHTHSYKEIVSAATCYEPGYTLIACDCGDCSYQDVQDKIYHVYIDDICIYCGKSAADLDDAMNRNVDGGQCGDRAMWKLDESGELTIFGEGEMTDNLWADSSPWYPVREKITAVTVLEGINTIGDYAFYNCENIETVKLPQSITAIGQDAFCSCKSLQNIIIPWAVTNLESSTFTNCVSLTDVVLPKGLVGIGEGAFINCTALETLTIPEKVTGIGHRAFFNCTSLEELYFLGDALAYGEYIQGEQVFHMYDENDAVVQLPNLTLYYLETSENWTSPEWYGLPTATWTPEIHEHSFSVIVREPTCTTFGYTEELCYCGEGTVYGYTAPLGHELVDLQGKEVSCSTDGYSGVKCTVCDNKNIEFLHILPHDHVFDRVIEPTCSSNGYNVYVCSQCGDEYWEFASYTNGEHTKELLSYILEPTCTHDGEAEYTCVECGEFFIETVPATGHEFVGGACVNCGEADHEKPSETESVGTEEPTESEEPSVETTEPSEEPSEPEIPTENPFVDVKDSDYFAQPVLWAVGKSITNGMSATSFAPNDDCTRGQIVTFLWRACGSPEPTETDNPFKDVAEDAYYYNAVLWAVEKGITTGLSATTFDPDATCTRGQVATFLWRAQGEPAPKSTDNPFSDVKSGDYYCEAVLWAVENNVTQGMGDGKFAPNASCTRGQIVTFLFRAIA